MTTEQKPASKSPDKPFIISRVFNAPRELVFHAWTDTNSMIEWFGPKDFKTLAANHDFKPGGTYHYGMQTPDGKEMWGKWTYREIVRPEKLVFISSFSDRAGGLTRHPLAPDWPAQLLTTVTFEEQKDKTKLTVKWELLPTVTEAERAAFNAGRDSMKGGWTGTIDRLDAFLARNITVRM